MRLFFSFRNVIRPQQSNLGMISRLKRKMSRPWQILRRKGNRGYCSICERQVYFEIEGAWLRDQYKCVNCQSIPRWRALMSVIAELYPKWRELKIHESSPGGPLSAKAVARMSGVSSISTPGLGQIPRDYSYHSRPFARH